ncbi:TIGR02444 family protein [Vreelandella aquamarina]|uniref:TIGR02444 family protein n=1 Tax=Vreelandella aquamarina TaxID=77097 RepID=UPI00384C2C83
MRDSNRLQRLQQRPLWDFALALYAQPGVEQACLTLQDDAGVDVCELLFHCWLYHHGLQAEPGALAAIREERHRWQQQVTATLRQLRRDLKSQAAHSESISTLRKTLQTAEIQAERENLQRWQQWALTLSDQEERLIKSDISQHNVAQWLQDMLFSRPLAPLPKQVRGVDKEAQRALTVLSGQLDRCESPR